MTGPVFRQLVVGVDVAWLLYAAVIYLSAFGLALGLVGIARWMRRL